MSTYSLSLSINPADLTTLLSAGEQIVLVRRLIDAGVPVAWAVVPPMQANLVTWTDDYQMFASAAPTNVGQTLLMNATKSATLQCDYDYSASGFSSPSPDGALPTNTLQIRNAVSNSNTFGFAQGYTRNGLLVAPCPINGQSVPARQFARLATSQSLWVYLSSGIQAGMVVNAPVTASTTRQVFSAALQVDFNAGITTQAIVYSSDLGQFVLSS